MSANKLCVVSELVVKGEPPVQLNLAALKKGLRYS